MKEFNELKDKAIAEIVKTSKTYVLNEQVRTELQEIVIRHMADGDIVCQEDVDNFVNSMKVAVNVLDTISFESWKMLSQSK